MAKKEAPKAPAAEGEAPKGSNKLKLIIIIVLGLLLVVGASIGGTWFLLSKKAPVEAAKSEAPAEPAAPVKKVAVYEPIAPAFVVNFKQDGKQRFMQVSVALMGRDAEQMKALNVHMPLIRNKLVMLFSSQDFNSLLTPVGRELLSQQATAAVQELAQKETGKPTIERVLFTNFVLQ